MAGVEQEPNNERGVAQVIGLPVEISGKHNDLYDVYAFTLAVTSTLDARLESGVAEGRSQVQFIDTTAKQSIAASAFDSSAAVTQNTPKTLPPGTHFVFVFTDPAFVNPQAGYRLTVRVR